MGRKKKSIAQKSKISLNSPDNKINNMMKQYQLATKLKHPSGKTVLITLKKMELQVMENDGKTNKVVEKHKYRLGDIGVLKYCSAVKRYISNRYILEGSTSNMDEIRKLYKKEE